MSHDFFLQLYEQYSNIKETIEEQIFWCDSGHKMLWLETLNLENSSSKGMFISES